MIVQNFFLVAECLCHVSLAGSIFITVSLSIERYQEGNQLSIQTFSTMSFTQAVFHPHWYQVRTMTEGMKQKTNKHEFEIKWRTFPAMIYKDAPFCDVSFCNLFEKYLTLLGHRRTLVIYLLPTIFLAIFLNIPR